MGGVDDAVPGGVGVEDAGVEDTGVEGAGVTIGREPEGGSAACAFVSVFWESRSNVSSFRINSLMEGFLVSLVI
jgi:hypothetical protein